MFVSHSPNVQVLHKISFMFNARDVSGGKSTAFGCKGVASEKKTAVVLRYRGPAHSSTGARHQIQEIQNTRLYIYSCNYLLSCTIFYFLHTTNPSKNSDIQSVPQIQIAKSLPSTTKVRDRRMANTTLTVWATSINKDTHFLDASDEWSLNLVIEKHTKNESKTKKLRNPRSFSAYSKCGWVKHSTVIKYSDFLLQPNIHSHYVRSQCFRCQSTLECPITSEHHSSPWLPKIGSIGHPSTRTNRILPIQIPGDHGYWWVIAYNWFDIKLWIQNV